jgi:TRAP-type C4-dicarboxylate transport system permease small subunit
VAWTCSSDKSFVLPIIGIVFLLLAAGGGVLSWRIWIRAGRTWPEDVTGLPLGRVQFMSILGVMLNTLFALVIIAQIIPDFIFGPCLD